jgi:hypothetical protein
METFRKRESIPPEFIIKIESARQLTVEPIPQARVRSHQTSDGLFGHSRTTSGLLSGGKRTYFHPDESPIGTPSFSPVASELASAFQTLPAQSARE